jgi:superkiller protein 3
MFKKIFLKLLKKKHQTNDLTGNKKNSISIESLNIRNLKSFIKKAFELYDCGKYENARQCFCSILNSYPGNVEALNGMGLALNNDEKAIWYFNEALKISPNNSILLINKALVLLMLERYPEAIDCCNKVLSIKSISILTKQIALKRKKDANNGLEAVKCNEKGMKFYEAKNYVEAIKCFKKAILLNNTDKYHDNPRNAKRNVKIKVAIEWNRKGMKFYKAKNYMKAIICYMNALHHNNTEEYHNNLKNAQRNAKIKAAIKWNRKGMNFYKVKNYMEAIICYKNAIHFNSTKEYLDNLENAKMEVNIKWDKTSIKFYEATKKAANKYYYDGAMLIDEKDFRDALDNHKNIMQLNFMHNVQTEKKLDKPVSQNQNNNNTFSSLKI